MDEVILKIARYAAGPRPSGGFETARLALLDALGCAAAATRFPEATKLLGPWDPRSFFPFGVKVPFTSYRLDPVKAALDTGLLVRWLDCNDTWLAREWAHPSDNLGAIWAAAGILVSEGKEVKLGDILEALIKAYEIQGVLSLSNSLNRRGFDHVLFVKVASAAVATAMLGGSEEEVAAAVSNAFLEPTLRTYRHAPNTGSRKSWAAGDATSRGLMLALWALRGEMGYPKALTASRWGVQDVLFGGEPVRLERELGHYVMDNVLFKPFPAEFHAQTAAEAALKLHPEVKGRIDEIERIVIKTQESAVRIIAKEGPLKNPADRDHCIQYIVAVALLYGKIDEESYSDETAADPRIDELRAKTVVEEEPRYSRDYLDPEKRSVANSVEVILKDGTRLGPVEVEYPLGHPRRRKELAPVLWEKARRNLSFALPKARVERLLKLFEEPQLEEVPFGELVRLV